MLRTYIWDLMTFFLFFFYVFFCFFGNANSCLLWVITHLTRRLSTFCINSTDFNQLCTQLISHLARDQVMSVICNVPFAIQNTKFGQRLGEQITFLLGHCQNTVLSLFDATRAVKVTHRKGYYVSIHVPNMTQIRDSVRMLTSKVRKVKQLLTNREYL